MRSFFHEGFTHRESCLANHVRCAEWAEEAVNRGKTDSARRYAMWARDWWARFLASESIPIIKGSPLSAYRQPFTS